MEIMEIMENLDMEKEFGRIKTRIRGFKEAELDFQLIRILATCHYNGASIGETFFVSNKLENITPDNWKNEFLKLAERLHQLGDKAAARNHLISARDYYFRASNYFRSAEFYADVPNVNRKLGILARESFINGLKASNYSYELLEIPYEDVWIPTYFLTPSEGKEKRPTLLMLNGGDGTSEECLFWAGFAGLERGYNVVAIDGPGQAGMFRLHPHTYLRYDYEVPIGLVIDEITNRSEVDKEKLALLGFSLGGYFSIRAAAFDDRIKAVIPSSPVVDAYKLYFAGFGDALEKHAGEMKREELGNLPNDVMSPFNQMVMKSHCYRTGVASLNDFFDAIKPYCLNEKQLAQIKCPSLALAGEGEGPLFVNQLHYYKKYVSGPVSEHIFKASEGAEAHCQLANTSIMSATVYDWLDDLFESI